MSSDLAFSVGLLAGWLALVVWLTWPDPHCKCCPRGSALTRPATERRKSAPVFSRSVRDIVRRRDEEDPDIPSDMADHERAERHAQRAQQSPVGAGDRRRAQ